MNTKSTKSTKLDPVTKAARKGSKKATAPSNAKQPAATLAVTKEQVLAMARKVTDAGVSTFTKFSVAKETLNGVRQSTDAVLLETIKEARLMFAGETGKYLAFVDAVLGNGIPRGATRIAGTIYEQCEPMSKVAGSMVKMKTVSNRLAEARKVAKAMANASYVTTDSDGEELSLQDLESVLRTGSKKKATKGGKLDVSPEGIKRFLKAVLKAGAMPDLLNESAEQMRSKLPEIAAQLTDVADELSTATAE